MWSFSFSEKETKGKKTTPLFRNLVSDFIHTYVTKKKEKKLRLVDHEPFVSLVSDCKRHNNVFLLWTADDEVPDKVEMFYPTDRKKSCIKVPNVT